MSTTTGSGGGGAASSGGIGATDPESHYGHDGVSWARGWRASVCIFFALETYTVTLKALALGYGLVCVVDFSGPGPASG